MARERWFYARDMRRMGPVPRQQLLESLLALPDPREVLIWRHGLAVWTPARDVPEIERQLGPRVEAPPARPADPVAVAARADEAEAPAPPRTAAAAADGTRRRPPRIGLYFGALGGLLAIVVLGWVVWPNRKDAAHTAATGNGAHPAGATDGAAGSANAATGGARPAGGAAANDNAGAAVATAFADQEAELTPDQLRLLRGVGGWTGQTLTITLYNGSSWRVTEILVRTSILRGEDFVDGETPHRLLPPGAKVDAGTAKLLDQVAPERSKPGVSPLDTGKFEAAVGPKPEGFRWRIEGARGFPPRR
jgi:hypothetical protein